MNLWRLRKTSVTKKYHYLFKKLPWSAKFVYPNSMDKKGKTLLTSGWNFVMHGCFDNIHLKAQLKALQFKFDNVILFLCPLFLFRRFKNLDCYHFYFLRAFTLRLSLYTVVNLCGDVRADLLWQSWRGKLLMECRSYPSYSGHMFDIMSKWRVPLRFASYWIWILVNYAYDCGMLW